MFYLLKDVHLEQVELMLLFIVNTTWYSPLDAYGIGFFLKTMKDIRRSLGIMFSWGHHHFAATKLGLASPRQ